MDSNLCPSCKSVFVGKYCSNCGQRQLKVPFDFKGLYSIIVEWVDFDKGFFFTLYSCYARPGRLIREYLSGATNRYFGPIKFTIVLIGLEYVVILVSYLMGLRLGNPDAPMDESGIDASPSVICFYVYLFAFNSVCFRSSLSIVEHLIISAYQFSALFVLSGLLAYVFGILSIDTNTISSVAFLFTIVSVYIIWFNVQVFKNSKWITVVKSLLCVMGFVGLFLILVNLP
jgi:hypothetical protein